MERLLSSFAEGDFGRRLQLSDRLDETDAVISMLHMLGEELQGVTISRNYFNSIFNSVSEMMLVLSAKGVIEDLNTAVCERLGYVKKGLIGRPVDVLTGEVRPSMLQQIRAGKGPDGRAKIWNLSFLTAKGDTFPVELTARHLAGHGTKGRDTILVSAQDIGPRLAAEGLRLRSVIDGQEEERMRLARDLHDDLGQQLAAAKFLVAAAVNECADPHLRERLRAANESLLDISAWLNRACYQLMPATLGDFGLVQAVRELGEKVERTRIMRVIVVEGREFPSLPLAVQIDLFRVIQEFMNNGLRHGEATCMHVRFGGRGSDLEVGLKENGKGFDPGLVMGSSGGLRNMHARIRSHGGQFLLTSKPGRGTTARIRITVNS